MGSMEIGGTATAVAPDALLPPNELGGQSQYDARTALQDLATRYAGAFLTESVTNDGSVVVALTPGMNERLTAAEHTAYVSRSEARAQREEAIKQSTRDLGQQATRTTVRSFGDWRDDGNCRGVETELMFPGQGASTREAKETCRGCSVREQCLEFALETGEKFGIWGGLSERERRRIRRQRSEAQRQNKVA